MSIFTYNQKPVQCVVFLKITGCCAHLISCLGRSDLRGLTCTGSEVVRKYTWRVPPVEQSRVALMGRSGVAALQSLSTIICNEPEYAGTELGTTFSSGLGHRCGTVPGHGTLVFTLIKWTWPLVLKHPEVQTLRAQQGAHQLKVQK